VISVALRRQPSVKVSPFPSLRILDLLPRKWPESAPFPFNSPFVHYYYMGRNGIYFLARLWGLRDQEILMPAYFHGVEVDTLLAAGAKLRFYPVDINMRARPEDIVSRLTRETRVIYVIHFLGFPGPVEELTEICSRRGLTLIEDCALSLLSKLGDRPLGSFGDAAVFSLHKTLPLPHGGALVVRNLTAASDTGVKRPSLISTLAYTASALRRDLVFEGGLFHNMLRKVKQMGRRVSGRLGVVPVGSEHFDVTKANLAMSRLSHWVMAHQDYDMIVERRRRNFLHLLHRLREISRPVFTDLPSGVCPLFYPLRVRDKSAILPQLLDRGVDAVNFWSTTPSMVPAGAFPEVETLRQTILELPCHQDLGPRAMDWIADQVFDLRQNL
jgi:dTDP-4-amino-4,6-dideoxygalactose transaminase